MISIFSSCFLHVSCSCQSSSCRKCVLQLGSSHSAPRSPNVSRIFILSLVDLRFNASRSITSMHQGAASCCEWSASSDTIFRSTSKLGLIPPEIPAHKRLRLPLTPPIQSSCHFVRGTVRRATRGYNYVLEEHESVSAQYHCHPRSLKLSILS